MGIAMPLASSQVRLQKVIARSGLASRRHAETLIQEGRVTVNGKTVTVLGTCIDPNHDHVKVNGRHLKPQPPDMFLLLHKPAGYVSTMNDPLNRPAIADLLDTGSVRLFPVGRLDCDSEGLLLLTNNGDIAQACLHPRNHVTKTYLVKIKGSLGIEEMNKLKKGLLLADGPTAPAHVRRIRQFEANSWIEITISEGRNHQVKRMLECVGHPVIKLKRIKLGPLALGDLPIGASRYLSDDEANALRALLDRHSSTPSRNQVGRKSPFPKSKGKAHSRRNQGP
jgi:23S rRNA pseudouridine2605 synthase